MGPCGSGGNGSVKLCSLKLGVESGCRQMLEGHSLGLLPLLP